MHKLIAEIRNAQLEKVKKAERSPTLDDRWVTNVSKNGDLVKVTTDLKCTHEVQGELVVHQEVWTFRLGNREGYWVCCRDKSNIRVI